MLDLDNYNELVICSTLRLTLPATGNYRVEEIAIDPGNVPVSQPQLLDITGAKCTRAACDEDGYLHLEFSSGHQIDVAGDEDAAWELYGKNHGDMVAPILITQKEVGSSTAATPPQRLTTMRWWTGATCAVRMALHRMFRAWPEPRRHYPRHYYYLERASMQREMRRL
ncbi:DUF6188 family protein [Mycobacterium sp. 29Ha]|nr:DUF6188 family protein [Mycobacterium sp. 29Ha]